MPPCVGSTCCLPSNRLLWCDWTRSCRQHERQANTDNQCARRNRQNPQLAPRRLTVPRESASGEDRSCRRSGAYGIQHRDAFQVCQLELAGQPHPRLPHLQPRHLAAVLGLAHRRPTNSHLVGTASSEDSYIPALQKTSPASWKSFPSMGLFSLGISDVRYPRNSLHARR
jgi:hypothetical protein